MTQTLSQLTDSLQALLNDDGTYFPDALCAAAIRQALKELNLAIPQHAAATVEAVAEQYEYEFEESNALDILDVLRQGTDTYADYNLSLDFDRYFEDDRPFFRLRSPEAEGQLLIIRYTAPYTINGLDGETDSSLPAFYDPVLLDGAAWQACLVRASSRVEALNFNADVIRQYQQLAEHFRITFQNGLARLGQRKASVSEPDRRGWGDRWNGQH